MLIEADMLGMLPVTTKTSVLSLLHKSNNRKLLPNYRPLSLTNCDYKIIAFVFAQRLQAVLPYIIHPDQAACIKDRYIGCNVRNLIDIYEFTETRNLPGAMLCVDFEKAFDTVEHNFLYSVLKRFNFGDNFVNWIKVLYNQPMFKMKNNGWISSGYPMHRGIRQGCPLVSSLFVLVIETLALMIRHCDAVKGIEIGEHKHKITLYADDATICVKDFPSISSAVNIIDIFSTYAGPKLSVKKVYG